ncbi:MAG: AAA family ATPase, partial [Gammaproteobacteria bacterium]|nr:AAA family ATPase [Gammaproteobacteria bacterium]
MARQIPIGISDFKELRTGDYYYVDKSLLITDVVHSGAKVILLPRPRRFGKTINLSMLHYFFDIAQEEGAAPFGGLEVAGQPDIMARCGRYPTIFLTFKDVKFSDYRSCLSEMALMLADLFDHHMSMIEKAVPTRADRRVIETLSSEDPNPAMLQRSLKVLSKLLHRATGQKAIVLVDEYDAPIHAGYRHQYYEEIIGFMRNLLSGAFKDNTHLEKGVLTGILRIAKESIFSGFNNPRVCTILDAEFSQRFGFTETEVERVLDDFNLQDRREEVSNWYNGYRFGPHTIYNPWSIMQYATDARFSSATAQPYWVNTSDNRLVRDLVTGKNAIPP